MTDLTKRDVIARYLPEQIVVQDSATVFAPSNIALCKYWGKRHTELNLPVNGSLSVSLGDLGTTTTLTRAASDSLTLNGQALANDEVFVRKVFAFIDLFRGTQDINIAVDTVNSIPTSAGLASSASGFAALTLALNDFFRLDLPLPVLSAFARMGSGSAARSLYHGFVEWHKGEQADGMDSFAEPISTIWQDFRLGLVKISTAEKKINSRDGMNRTVETAQLYQAWPKQAEHDLQKIRHAIAERDFISLGETAEHNALSMHATMIATWPPVLYWQSQSVTTMQTVWALRAQGLPVYFTMDAGPNVKLLFEEENSQAVREAFADITVIAPFSRHR